MKESVQWQGLPYYPISQFYKKLFGEKVYKVPVSFVQTCPNREGIKGMKTCNFCDVWGSAAYPEFRSHPIDEQMKLAMATIGKRFNVHKFLAYFQAYTNTFTKTQALREQMDLAGDLEGVCGFVIGTRPDCISEAVLKLWSSYLEKTFLSVELGVQTLDEGQLLWMRRGHTAEDSLNAVYRIRKACPSVDLGIHLMFGLKGETEDQIVEMAQRVSQWPINSVKLHNLHVLKHTPLETEYRIGEFDPLSIADYTARVILFLEHLDPRIAVHRVSAVASRHDELVAPDWAAGKLSSYQYILDTFKRKSTYQGKCFSSTGLSL